MGKVFDPYFTTKSSGSGLGLLIVRRIVREHGGEIELRNDTGRGSDGGHPPAARRPAGEDAGVRGRRMNAKCKMQNAKGQSGNVCRIR